MPDLKVTISILENYSSRAYVELSDTAVDWMSTAAVGELTKALLRSGDAVARAEKMVVVPEGTTVV